MKATTETCAETGAPLSRVYDKHVASSPLPDHRADVAGRVDGHAVQGAVTAGQAILWSKKLTVMEAARVMNVGETKMREVLRRGDIPVVQVAGKVLIMARDLEDYLQGHYGPLRASPSQSSGRLPPLPKCVAESSLLKKRTT